ncbi:hypothetical protein D210916BOD24_34860 [Alteromonas sp. D210916BOD_24]|uniref:hypothetical protein n=1 Tax=Alteromonas sp. D210916BOD_24 TaxID=3157618 RepID=UPI00399C9C60
MKKTDNDKTWLVNILKILIVVAFAATLGFFINYFHSDESDTTEKSFTLLADTFRNHVATSHWQWRVQQPTTMIMLIHYDDAGAEVNRKPVRMNHNGWPTADLSDEGCEKIWTSLVAAPLRVDGFKVIARFYSNTTENENNYWCRYSLSSGAYFDYYPSKGEASAPTF